MGRPPIKRLAMTPAQRQRRYRAGLAFKAKRAVVMAKRERRARTLDLVGVPASGADLWRPGDARVFSVIYADPPWRFEPWSRETGLMRSADLHYATLATTEIAALPVPAAPDAVLFLWATAPMLLDALAVLAAWGFTYKTNFAWTKSHIATGYWNRNQHEHLLIGTRGRIPAPAQGEQFPSVVVAPVGAHSEKPSIVYEMIEAMFPDVARIEMFARTLRAGWTSHGNELRGITPSQGVRNT